MKWLVTLLLLYALPAVGQNACTCTTELGPYLDCDTTRFKNGARLYYQCNPASYWLTLQQKDGQQKVLFRETEPDVFHLAGRLRYQLVKEYDPSLLFRYGCGANGPCMFAVVNKHSGKQLLDKTDRDLFQDPYVEPTDFLLFYDSTLSYVQLFYLNTLKQYQIPDKQLRLPHDPDYSLARVSKTRGKIQLHYKYFDGKDLVRTIDQRRYPE